MSQEKTMAPHSSILAWQTPWMVEPGGLQSMGSLRVGHDWATSLSLSLSSIGEGNGNPLQCSCLENSRDRGAWWAAVYGVAESRTRLKQLSSSSSRLSQIWDKRWMRKIWQTIEENFLNYRKIMLHLMQKHNDSNIIYIYSVAITFWKHICMLSHSVMPDFFVTPWTVVCQAPLSVGILQARILECRRMSGCVAGA